VRPAIFTVPAFLLKRLPGGMSSLFLDSQRVEPVVMQSFDFAWSFPDLESALRDVESKS
jgi:NAD dependent epimerase/dehydratase family enzyme